MIGKRLVAIALGSFIVIATACQGDGQTGDPSSNGSTAATQPATQPTATQQAAPPELVADIDPAAVEPPPIDSAVQFTPFEGEQLERARMSLDAILAELDTPDYLETAQATQPAAEPVAQPGPATGEPPLAAQRAYVAGRQAWHNDNTFQAISELERALRLAPRRPRILRLLGRIYTEAGNTVRGAVQLKEAVRLQPDDIESIAVLGRFAVRDGRLDEAIVTFHHALTRAQEAQDNSARVPVLHYYLGDALARAGYAAAAIEQHEQFQSHSRGRVHYSQSGQELAILREQAGLTWRAVGDMHHRLDQPAKALKAYQTALDDASPRETDFVARLIYTYLRLEQARPAYELAIEHMRRSGADDASLALVRYVTEQGISGQALAQRLRAVYQREGRSAALAMALADLLPAEQGRALLSEHLQHRPGDTRVFTKLIESLMPEGARDASVSQRAEAITVTADAMAGAPEHVEARAQAMFEAAGNVSSLLDAFDSLDQAHRTQPMVLLLRGFALMQTGDVDEAREPLQSALEASPELRPARLALVRLAIQREDYEKARELLEPLADSDDSEVLSLRVGVLAQAGELEQAAALLDQRIAQGGADTELLLQKASLQLRAEKAAEAERTLLDALNAHPEDERIYNALLRLYDPQGEEASPIEDADRQRQRVIRRLLRTIPESRRARLVRAELLIQRGQTGQAEQLLQGLLDEKGVDLEAVQQLLQLYFRTNRRDQAMAMLDEQIEAHPDHRPLLALALQVFSNEHVGDSRRALDVANRLVELEPTSPAVIYHLTRLYVEADNAAKAIPVIERALESEDIEDPSMFTQLLWQAMWNADRGEQAIDRLEALAKKFDEHTPDIRMQISYLLTVMGEKERSEQVLVDVLKAHPDHPATNNALGYSWADEGRKLEEARKMIQKAVDAEPDSASYLDSLGWVYYKLGEFDKAVRWLRRAQAAGGGSHPVIVDHLGDALYRTGNEAEAKQQWRRTLMLLNNQPPRLSPNPETEGMEEELREKINADDDPPIAPVPEQGGENGNQDNGDGEGGGENDNDADDVNDGDAEARIERQLARWFEQRNARKGEIELDIEIEWKQVEMDGVLVIEQGEPFQLVESPDKPAVD